MSKKINIKQKFSKFSELWSPKVIAEMNDYQFKIVKIHGEFVWHKHDETDEVFIVIEGSMKIQFRKKTINLNQGELFIVPKGVEHKPFAADLCKIMIVEPRGVMNTGNINNELTAKNDTWI
tara:strand:+ start:278 stop:640 length:363 start_codon:yes stop_codon:yes gene_type:complete